MNFEEFREQLRNDLPGKLPEDMQNISIDFQHIEKLQNDSIIICRYLMQCRQHQEKHLNVHLDIRAKYTKNRLI